MKRFVLALPLVACSLSTPAAASTLWGKTEIAKTAASAGKHAEWAADGDVNTGWFVTLAPRGTAWVAATFRSAQTVKGLQVHLGPVPKGVKLIFETTWDGQHYRMVNYDLGPKPAGPTGTGFNEWTEATGFRIRFEAQGLSAPVRLQVYEMAAYVEE